MDMCKRTSPCPRPRNRNNIVEALNTSIPANRALSNFLLRILNHRYVQTCTSHSVRLANNGRRTCGLYIERLHVTAKGFLPLVSSPAHFRPPSCRGRGRRPRQDGGRKWAGDETINFCHTKVIMTSYLRCNRSVSSLVYRSLIRLPFYKRARPKWSNLLLRFRILTSSVGEEVLKTNGPQAQFFAS